MSGPALRVIQAHANHGVAVDRNGRLFRFPFPRRIKRPLPGDQVRLDDAGTLDSVVPRRNHFGRGDQRGRFRPIAANLDCALIVIAAQPAPSPDLLHRYLVAAHIQGIEPVVVVNKSDLTLPDKPPFAELATLAEMGYEVIHTQCRPEPDIAELATRVASGVSLFAGQSGVGKSSLLNTLIPDLDVQTGKLSRVTGKGTHTTTSATLHHLPTGGWLVDTPGVWEYGLWVMPVETLQQGFPEFRTRAGDCRFRDCRHDSEPRCAVRAAVADGTIPAFRHRAWLRLLAEQQRLSAG